MLLKKPMYRSEMQDLLPKNASVGHLHETLIGEPN